jgi:hypothetical protein
MNNHLRDIEKKRFNADLDAIPAGTDSIVNAVNE